MSIRPSAPAAAGDERSFFLPDFCAAPAVHAIVLIAALLGVVLALVRQSAQGAFWTELARVTASLLWAGLLCAAAQPSPRLRPLISARIGPYATKSCLRRFPM